MKAEMGEQFKPDGFLAVECCHTTWTDPQLPCHVHGFLTQETYLSCPTPERNCCRIC
jgi:hypothetical protein